MDDATANKAGTGNASLRDYDSAIIRSLRQEHRLLKFDCPRLLDIGTGTGQMLVRLCEHADFSAFELIGTDNSPDVLEVANDIVASAGLQERVAFHQNDAHALPYADDSFEYVTCQSTIHQWHEPVRALGEVFRVLKPNGVAIIHEPRRDVTPSAIVALRNKYAKLGLEPDTLDDKHTPVEVWDIIQEAGLAPYSVINSPSAWTGFEIRIAKSASDGSVPADNSVRTQAK